MIIDHKHIDSAFSQSLTFLAQKYKCVGEESALYLKFQDKEPRLFFYSKSSQTQAICFSKIISSKMIGLGMTIEKIYMALYWLSTNAAKNLNINNSTISLLLFRTEQKHWALIGLCVNGKHVLSYRLGDVLQQFETKQQHLN